MQNTFNPYFETKEEILKVGRKYKIPEEKLENFLIPDRLIEVKIPIKDKNGKTKVYKGFRSQHNNKLGPYKGGIRFHARVTQEEVMALSIWMSLKCSVANLPFGGGKGGIIVDPKILSEKELEELSREYIRKIAPLIGPFIDVPAPDVNTNPKIMNWMMDEYIKINQKLKIKSEKLMATFTGKPLTAGGLEGRTEATGFGGVVILKELVKKLRINSKNKRIAVQGFGNVGYYFSLFASQAGFKVVCVSDSGGGIIKTLDISDKATDGIGLDIPLVMDCKKRQGTLAGCYCAGGVCNFKEGKILTNEEVLELPVEILVPAALEGAINEGNMKKIKAEIIIEMANGPITPAAYSYLTKKGVLIVPDILANSGGVTGSYIEWKQNLKNEKYKKTDSLAEIEKIMVKAFNNIWKTKERYNTDFKEAAYIFALQKLI